MTESATLGLVGGTRGVAIGLAATVAVSVARQWTPLIDPTLLLVAPGIGLTVGIVAGTYPTWRATRIEPTQALRQA